MADAQIALVTDRNADLARALRHIIVFADLPAEDVDWLAARMEWRHFEAGEILVRSGTRAEFMTVVLEGEIHARNEADPADDRQFTVRAGMVVGLLPYSRLTTFPLTSRGVTAGSVAVLHRDLFPEMLQRIPILGQRLVNVMADRIREYTREEQQREKLAALGKLSAGLAHELNNPAAAAQRAASNLREAVAAMRQANIRLDERSLNPEQRSVLTCVEREISERPHPDDLDPLERSDREDALSAWLTRHSVARPWDYASSLVDAGFDTSCLDEVSSILPIDTLEDALIRMTASISVGRLTREIENSTSRISDLVRAIKEYTYMDQAPEQEVDVHQGIESTLVMLRPRWKQGVRICRYYDPELPKICAHGSELNQVWTNLIENAIDAMNGQGELRIRTMSEGASVLVEIGDNGPGIPAEIHDRVFEPFFTTKGVGEGTGLGLDTVYRIVRRHRGEVRFESCPGDTRFQVRLPFARPEPVE
jgi:signal transduction histidine kinase